MPASDGVVRTPRRLAHARTVEALAGRGWLLALLAAPRGDDPPPPPRLAAESWALVLSVESVGLPVASALRARGLRKRLPTELVAAVEAAEVAELQRVMMARGQLLQLDAIAVELGLAPVVVKGGVAVMSGEPVDLGDLDVLVAPREDALRLAAALSAAGHARPWPDVGLQAVRHYVRQWPDGLAVEVHTRADYGPPIPDWGGVRRLGGLGAVCRSAPRTEVTRLLRHTVVEHAYRRGRLRDIVLLAQALERLSKAESGEVAGGLAGEACAAEQLAMLELARTVAAREGLAPDWRDPFAHVSALRYERRQRPPVGARVLPLYRDALLRSAGGAGAWVRWAGGMMTERIEPGTRWELGPVRRLWPAAGVALGYLARALYRGPVLGVAAVSGWAARRRARAVVMEASRG